MAFTEAQRAAVDADDTARLTRWVRVEEAMAYLGIKSRNTITKYVAEGMPHHRRGGRGVLLFDLQEIEEWVRSRWSAPAPRHSTNGRIG